MNLPSHKRMVPFFTLLIIIAILVTLPYFDSEFFASLRYAECSRLVSKDPHRAITLARSWRTNKPHSLFAYHCEAIALYATGDYNHAAQDFMGLAKEAETIRPALSDEFKVQGARAYIHAGDINSAENIASSVLAHNPANIEAKSLLAELTKEK